MAWADQALLTLVIGNGATLMGADHRISEDTGLGSKDNRWHALASGGK